jgi:hypothetical protein
MTVQLLEPGKPTSLEQIERFEVRRHVRLPESYKAFLLKHNGGRPIPNEFAVPGWGGSCVHRFLGFGGDQGNSIEAYSDIYGGRLPAGFVPIALDPAGNLVCVSTRPESDGHVYFWDHEQELDESGNSRIDMTNMFLLARDVPSFLRSLASSSTT